MNGRVALQDLRGYERFALADLRGPQLRGGLAGHETCGGALMPISGLVIRMKSECPGIREEIARDERITLGSSQHPGFQPAVLETTTLGESEAVVEALLSRDGVLGIDIVTVDFSDCVQPTEGL